MTRRVLAFLVFVVACVLDWGVSAPEARADSRPLVIGSKNFPESRLLAEIMAQLLESSTDLTVDRRSNLGGTTVVFQALVNGEIDIYPEYSGTGWAILVKMGAPVHDPLEAFLRVAQESERRFGVVWMLPFGFSNSYAMAMDEDRAEALGVKRISDLRRHQSELRVGVTHEFLNREDGWPGLAAAYALDVSDLRGVEHGLAYEAVRTGRIDLIDTYTTDGKLLRYNLRLLEDDRQFFPPYDAAPVVRRQTLERHPEVREVLTRLAFQIDDEAMRRLNYRIEDQGESFAAVASDFLRSKGLLEGEAASVEEASPEGILAFLWSRRGETLGLVLEHLQLTAISVLLAILVAVPLGVILTRKAAWAPAVLGAAGVIQTIPSLALLAFMIPIPGLGLGVRPAIAALFLYALLPILRNAYTGIKEVDPNLLEAARAMGLKDHQTLFRVELPLAVRTIMAGVRTSTVISVGVATLAAFIGAGGLGDPILTGLQLNDIRLILSGAIPAAILALVVDALLGQAEKLLVPAGLR